MSKRYWGAVTALAYSAVVLAWALAGPPGAKAPAAEKDKPSPAKDTQKDAAKDVFGLRKVWHFDLQISAKEWDQMQPVGGMRFPGGPGGPGGRPGFGGPGGPGGPERPPEKPAERPADTHKGSGFGMEFPWVHAAFTADGKTYQNVGVRFKGNASYMTSARGLKRNFKIELDHYDTDLRFHGLKTINLNAGAMDPTKGREALSYAVFRAGGVPAPRTAFVEVTLTVPGKFDKEYLGLYTFVEQVDKTFLKDRFQNSKGLLMKPERLRGIEYLGDDWAWYKDRYRPKHEPSKKEARRVIEFAKLVNKADDEQFRKQIGSYLDVDEFLRFIAVNALVANLDSIFSMGHNFYIYLNPATNRFVFLPWDLDLSLAGFPMAGAPEQQMDLSLTHPHSGENKLIDRLLAIKEVQAKYQTLLQALAATCFTKERLLKDVEAIEQATKEPLVRETKAAAARKEGGGFGFGPPGGGRPAGGPPGFGPPGGGPPGGGPPGGGMFGRTPDLRTFVAKRTESVAGQLDGKSKGYVPTGRGFGPGGPGGPGGFGPGNFLARPMLEVLDGDKDGKVTKEEWLAAVKRFFKDCDKDTKGKLDERGLADGLNRLFPPPPPGFGPPGGPGPGGPSGPGGPPPGPGGFGGPRFFSPGPMLASAVVKRADTNKDGLVTLDELVTAAEALFKECDKDKNGSLDEKELAAGIGLLLPPPPGFGPPGFGPPGGRPEEPRKEESKP